MRRRVVILGAGFGGAYCARELQRRSPETEVVLIDRNNYFVFYPLLIEAGTGSLHPNHVVVPVRSFAPKVKFIMASVTGVDFRDKVVKIVSSAEERVREIPYDHLLVSLGSATRLPEVPGLGEHGFEVKSLGDALRLRDRAIQLIEEAHVIEEPTKRRARLHLVVVGANFTGAEVAGEFNQYLRRAAGKHPNLEPDDVQVTLVELSDRILGSLDPELSEFARINLERRGIRVVTGTSVESIDGERVQLASGEALQATTVVWCAGIEPSRLIRDLELPTDERGYIECDDDLRVRGHDDVWAIGDCAVNRDEHGIPYPSTAQHAVRQGVHAARNIVAALRGRPTSPFVFKSRGSLVALGCRSGVAKVGRFKLSGFPAWWLHRTAYLFKMPGVARKVRVALDWTLDLFFDRDYVSLGAWHEKTTAPDSSEDRSGTVTVVPAETSRRRTA